MQRREVMQNRTTIISALEQKYYNRIPGWKNGTEEFHLLLAKIINNRKTEVLEVGPGPLNKTSSFLATCAKNIDGIDIDKRALKNAALNNIIIYDGEKFPINSYLYDLVVADYVMEHVEHPKIMLQEINRVLKQGGLFVFRTPNLFHYVSIISKLTPQWLHLLIANRSRARSNDAEDPYPTFYRFNSSLAIRELTNETYFSLCDLSMVEKQPSYLKFNSFAFLCGIFYERIVNNVESLSGLRANIFGILRKPIF